MILMVADADEGEYADHDEGRHGGVPIAQNG